MVCQVSNIAGNSGRIIVSFVTYMTSAERCKLPSFVFKVMLEALCYLHTARFFCFVPFQGDRWARSELKENKSMKKNLIVSFYLFPRQPFSLSSSGWSHSVAAPPVDSGCWWRHWTLRRRATPPLPSQTQPGWNMEPPSKRSTWRSWRGETWPARLTCWWLTCPCSDWAASQHGSFETHNSFEKWGGVCKKTGRSMCGQQGRHADGSPLHAVTLQLLSMTVLKNTMAGRNRKVCGRNKKILVWSVRSVCWGCFSPCVEQRSSLILWRF